MKKQIVINASKDRSRIAIVEDGEFVELYVETPDNVRSIGNVYLASIQKVMPALRAAFVDVGQKQDCFLHFSDLTDNLPQLLALAGEDVPGLDEPVLSLAPPKRVADDEDEPDVEESLEIEPAPEESRSRRTSRRRSRGRGRGRGKGRREEEEEQEEAGGKRRALPSVIDLTAPSKPRRAPKPAPEPADEAPSKEPESDASSADASAPVEGAAPKKKSTRRRSRQSDAGDAAEPDAASESDTSSADDRASGEAESKKKPTRRRSRTPAEDEATPAAADTDAPTASDDAEPDAPEDAAGETLAEDEPKKKRRRRGRRGGRGKGSDGASEDSASDSEASDGEATDEPSATSDDKDSKPRGRRSRGGSKANAERGDDSADTKSEASDDVAEKPKAKTSGRKSLPATLDLTSSAKPSRSKGKAEPKGEPESKDESEDDRGSSRRRRSAKPDASESSRAGGDGEASEAADETSPRGFKKPSRRKTRSSSDEESSESDAPSPSSDSADAESESRSRRRSGRRSKESAGDAETTDAPSESSSESSDDAKPSGRSRGRSGRGRQSGGDEGQSGRSVKESDDSDESDKESGRGRSGRSGRSGGGRSAGGRSSSGRSSNGRSSGGRNAIPSNEELLKRDGRIIVKITKEAISNKGPRVSTDLSLAGRFLVLVPAADYVAVSKKIESAKERRRLRTLATSLKPDGFGVIVRTVAEGRDAKSLDTDLRLLADKWRKIQNKLDEKPNPPVLLYQDVNMVSSVIRDLFSEDYDRILVDDEKTFRNVQAYVKAVAPQMADKVEFHKGRGQVFRSLGIEKQVEEAFSKRVNMRGGGYLFIETTEAMHVVDVNSGRAGRGKSQKQNLIDVNVEAAREVAKQLRLRDLGGIIVVDFIDLKYDRDRRKVTDALKEEFEKDRAVTKLLPMSDFGLVQITRQRLRPSITAGAVDEDGERLEGSDAMEAAGAGEIVQPGKSLERRDGAGARDAPRRPSGRARR